MFSYIGTVCHILKGGFTVLVLRDLKGSERDRQIEDWGE